MLDGMLQKTSTTTRLLELLVAILGSTEAAREALQCSESEFESWLRGLQEPPWPKFERMIDMVVEYQSKAMEQRRDALRALHTTKNTDG
jgi:hypothetical protein